LGTERERQFAKKQVELAAERELLNYAYRRDKGELRLPQHLERFATDALKFDAYSGTLMVRGMETASRWVDTEFLWCTLVVSQSNVSRMKEFADQFRRTGAYHYLKSASGDATATCLYKAFELKPDLTEVRAALSRHFLSQGYRVAAFVVHQKDTRLPQADDSLAQFLLSSPDTSWDEGRKWYQSEKPDLIKALGAFLRALDTRYIDPDAFNYVGVCYQQLGWTQLASVFFDQALNQAPMHLHPFALTNQGLCLLNLDRAKEARVCLEKAVQTFPDHPWTQRARNALAKLKSDKD
jgi:tetratricopeptide (TPR) repeat protein